MTLCDTCKKLNLNPERFIVLGEGEDDETSTIAFGTVERVKTNDSCPFCRLVLVALGGNKVPNHTKDNEPICVELSWDTDGPAIDPSTPWSPRRPKVRVLRPHARRQDGGIIWDQGPHFNLFPEITLLVDDAPVGVASDPTVTTHLVRQFRPDKIDFTLVRRWLSLCDKHHGPACHTNPILAELGRTHPTREMSEFRCVDVINNCLVTLPENGRYAALSYVWGRKQFFTTLKENVKRLAQPEALLGLKDQQIPQTIQDAIHLTREIGLDFLWVDSLCIVQDDDSGMKMQYIRMMDVIYAAADLVIVAAGSAGAHEGIAGIRDGTRGVRQPVEPVAPGCRLAFKTRWQDALPQDAYWKRGWTFQEWNFAARALVFSGGQVVFRCFGQDAWQEHLFEASGGPSDTNPLDTVHDDIGEFEGLIQTYSERVLSFDTDVYNAFAGVSRQLAVRLGPNTHLCHGVPTVFFDWFLLWTPLAEQTRREGVAPSWSWAGWVGGSWPRMWDWYMRSIPRIRRAVRTRTWIIWHQRQAHDLTECRVLVRLTPEFEDESGGKWQNKDQESSPPCHSTTNLNFYGAESNPITRFIGLDCARTQPTSLKLTNINPPVYIFDVTDRQRQPGSGYLQFLTVSMIIRLTEPAPLTNDTMRAGKQYGRRLGLVGCSGRELGQVTVPAAWADERQTTLLKEEREVLLICEGRDERVDDRRDADEDEDGWRYMVMLIEWRGKSGEVAATGEITGTAGSGEGPCNSHSQEQQADMYAERVGLGSIGKNDWEEGLWNGAVWKEIILG